MDGRERARQLIAQGKFDELRQSADDGDSDAQWMSASLLLLSMDETALKAGNDHARLADLLARQERLDELRELVEKHYPAGTSVLAELLAKQGRLDELRRLQAAGRTEANRHVADILVKQGRIDELRAQADAGNRAALTALVMLQKREKDVEGPQARAHGPLIRPDVTQERLDELRRLAAADQTDPAFRELVTWLAEHEQIDELEDLSRTGDSGAVAALARLAPERLWPRAEAGDTTVIWQLSRAYRKQQNVDELRRLAALGGHEAQIGYLSVLRQLGMLDELKARAEAGEPQAMSYWVGHLAEVGKVDELRALADDGEAAAAIKLAEILEKQGRMAEVVARAKAGDRFAALHLSYVIAPVYSDNPEDRIRP